MALAQGKRPDHLAGGQSRQPGFLLLLGASQQDGFGRQVDGGRERHRSGDAAELLGDHGKLEVGQPEPAELLGNHRGRVSHLHDLLPELGVVGGVSLQHCPDHGRGAIVGEKAARLLPQQVLVFVEFEVHEHPQNR